MTGTWFTLDLGDGLTASEPLDRIEDLFRVEYRRAGRPTDMAVFISHQSEGRLHCEVFAYFSPASAALAKGLGAVPCGRPSPDVLRLFAGAGDAWPALFPEHRR
ncbi:MAG: hypothetical protein HYS20_09050 [Rhodocyclales bacterium]|nr:hypothetical protein [Rhodocyclales bacterium]